MSDISSSVNSKEKSFTGIFSISLLLLYSSISFCISLLSLSIFFTFVFFAVLYLRIICNTLLSALIPLQFSSINLLYLPLPYNNTSFL